MRGSMEKNESTCFLQGRPPGPASRPRTAGTEKSAEHSSLGGEARSPQSHQPRPAAVRRATVGSAAGVLPAVARRLEVRLASAAAAETAQPVLSPVPRQLAALPPLRLPEAHLAAALPAVAGVPQETAAAAAAEADAAPSLPRVTSVLVAAAAALGALVPTDASTARIGPAAAAAGTSPRSSSAATCAPHPEARR